MYLPRQGITNKSQVYATKAVPAGSVVRRFGVFDPHAAMCHPGVTGTLDAR